MTHLGPYQLRPNENLEQGIYAGDSMLLLAELPANCIDLIVTSPPYDNLRAYGGYAIRVPSINADDKRMSTYRQIDGSLSPQWRGGAIGPVKIKDSIWLFHAGQNKSTQDDYAFAHPGIFPEALARDHILSWSNASDVVLDPFVGSGTTAKMCVLTNRHYLGFDINDQYVNLARHRVEQAQMQIPMELGMP